MGVSLCVCMGVYLCVLVCVDVADAGQHLPHVRLHPVVDQSAVHPVCGWRQLEDAAIVRALRPCRRRHVAVTTPQRLYANASPAPLPDTPLCSSAGWYRSSRLTATCRSTSAYSSWGDAVAVVVPGCAPAHALCSACTLTGCRSGDWFYQVVEVAALGLTITLIVQLTISYAPTYDKEHDRFGGPHLPTEFGIAYIVGPALLLAIVRGDPGFCACGCVCDPHVASLRVYVCFTQLLHPALNNFWISDVSWTFALYMEAVAIVPQLYMFHRKGGEVESFTSHFVVCLGIARVMHFAFWLSTHHELENRMSALPGGWLVGYVVLFSQLVHMLLMVDFFYYYFVRFVDPALLLRVLYAVLTAVCVSVSGLAGPWCCPCVCRCSAVRQRNENKKPP